MQDPITFEQDSKNVKKPLWDSIHFSYDYNEDPLCLKKAFNTDPTNLTEDFNKDPV